MAASNLPHAKAKRLSSAHRRLVLVIGIIFITSWTLRTPLRDFSGNYAHTVSVSKATAKTKQIDDLRMPVVLEDSASGDTIAFPMVALPTSPSTRWKVGMSGLDVAVAQICVDDVCVDDIVGEWVLDQNKTFAAPVCCGWDNYGWVKNKKQCGKKKIKSSFRYRGLLDRYQQVGGNACTCKGFEDKYTWRSSHKLPDWKATETCRLLGNRTVLVIGDSTMQQLASTLMNSIFPVGCQTQIKMAISQTLIGEALGKKHSRGKHWLKAVAKAKPDIVIISAGAHILNRTDFNRVIDTVSKEIGELKNKHPNVTVVWKTQSPAGCSADITFPKPSGKIFNRTSSVYQHAEFFERDLYAIHHFQTLGIPLLDFRMLYSRTDAHIGSQGRGNDCLHFCIPGPLEVGNVLFQNLLATI
jgi:hypothetical protein